MRWVMSVGDWLKDWIPSWTLLSPASPLGLPSRMDGPRVADALISELLSQMRVAEDREREEEQERRRSVTGGVDYSWLVTSPARSRVTTLPEMERLELESLCSRVTPEESGRVMRAFRQALLREPSAAEMTGIFRAVVRQTLEARAARKDRAAAAGGAGSSMAWLSRSMANLRRLRTNAVSVGSEDSVATDVEMQSCDSAACSSTEEFRV